MAEEKIKKIDLGKNKKLVFVIAVCLATLFFGNKIWKKGISKIGEVNNNINNYKEQINLANQINLYKENLKQYTNLGWPSKESIGIMGKINELARKYSIEIQTFDPHRLNEGENYSSLPLTISIRAAYLDLVRFLSALEELETITKIMQLRISPEQVSADVDKEPIVYATVVFHAFIMK